MAEKTDLGRLTSPSIIKLADESLRLNSGSQVNGRLSAQIWDDVDKILEVLYLRCMSLLLETNYRGLSVKVSGLLRPSILYM